MRVKIQQYVVAASKLYRRGTLLLNLVAMRVCGRRHPGATDCSVPVWRPRWTREGALTAGTRALVAMFEDGGRIEGNTLKHAFLPERWPSDTVPVNAYVASELAGADFGPLLPSASASWREIMPVSGWDNAINRMMTKFFGNVQVHAMANLPKAVRRYLDVVPLSPDAPRQLLSDAVYRPLRPIEASNDDWAMAMDLRGILQGPQDGTTAYAAERRRWFIQGYTSDSVAYSPDVLLLHLFLVRFGPQDRSYLPVASRGRKYAYVDAKVATMLFGMRKAVAAIARDDAEAGGASVSVGELLGLTPARFNQRRKEQRRLIRRRKRARCSHPHPSTTAEQRKRRKKDRDRWARLGASRMPVGARVDSFETDGVGLRPVLKTKVDMTEYIRAVVTSARDDGGGGPSTPAAIKKTTKKPAVHVAVDPARPAPLVVGFDNGRAKLFMASISLDATGKPASMGFTRSRYYFEMGHSSRRRWEASIMARSAALREAVQRLSRTGGTGNCDPECWAAYLRVETAHRTLLDDEFVGNIERAKWTMRMHRAKKRSLDGAVRRVLGAATTASAGRRQPLERPLVLGIVAGGFPACGPRGELPAPTSELSKAFARGIAAVRSTGRHVVTLSVDEFRTTMCCCACGSVTKPKSVRRRRRDKTTGETILQDGPSRRLRCCTTCKDTGKIRDRDVQGARNILWLTFALYYGLERPKYLRRGEG